MREHLHGVEGMAGRGSSDAACDELIMGSLFWHPNTRRGILVDTRTRRNFFKTSILFTRRVLPVENSNTRLNTSFVAFMLVVSLTIKVYISTKVEFASSDCFFR